MAAHDDEPRAPASELTGEELATEQARDLPDREAMSTFGHHFGHGFENFAMPINEAEAANISSNSSVAAADADQVVIINQGIPVPPEDA